MEKDRQKQLQETLVGVGADGKPFAPEHYTELSMQDMILLHHMAAVFMQNNVKNAKQKLFFAQRMAFFENHIILKLWALPECFAIVKKSSQVLYTEKNPKSDDTQIFVFSTKEAGETAVKNISQTDSDIELKTITHNQFPPFYLNLFSRGITAVIIDRGQTVIGIPLWAVCSRLKEDFILEQSRPAVRLWIKKEIYMLYSTLTKLPYVECDSETFDDLVLVYGSKGDAESAVKNFEEKGIPVYIQNIPNKMFHKSFFELYLMGVNALRTGEHEIIQLTNLVPKPDYSRLPEEKQPILNPEFLLTAVYICQEERRPDAKKDTEEIKQMKEELFAHLKESRLAMPVLVLEEESDSNKIHFPIVTLQNGERYCPVFTDIQTARDFEEKEDSRLKESGEKRPQYKYMKMYFDKIIQALPQQLQGVIINPNTINLMMRKTQESKS